MKLYCAKLITMSIANFPVGPNAFMTSIGYEYIFSFRPASASRQAEAAEKKPEMMSKNPDAMNPPFANALGRMRTSKTQ